MSVARNLRLSKTSKTRRMFIESLEDRKVLDAEPLLVKDINTSYNPVELNDASRMPTVLGSIGLYSGYSLASGRELWRTDGTVGGTSLIKDINAGPEDSVPQNFVEMGGSYYFTALTSDAGRELWKTDGTEAGTSLVMDIYPGELSSNPSALYAADGQLYFSANSPEFGNELWVSDGTTAGTRQLVDIYPGFAFGVSDIYKFNNHLLFNSITSGQKITSLDLETLAFEYPVLPVSFSSPVELSNGRLLFVADVPSGKELWTTDGTIAGTTLLANFQPSGSSVATLWTRFNGSTIVSYPNGPTLVVASLSDGGVFDVLVEVPAADGELAVSAALPDRLLIASSSKLYSSDGTSAGTVEVTLQPGISVDIRDSAMFAGSLYFALTGEGFGVAKYDPIDGTLSRITENRQYQAFSFQTTADGLYWLERPFIFNELQYFDGVTTVSLYDDGDNSWLYARALETINGNLVFVGVNGSGVALRGATSNSIVKLSPIDAGPTSGSLTSSNTVQLNGQQFMGVYLNGQIELWSTDGTEAGTNPLTSNPFAYFSPLQMVATNTKVFAVGLGPTGVELWTSDGTVAGTTLVTTLSFQPDWIVAYQNQIVMAGNGGLWASDGSESDLRLIASMSGTFAQTPAVWQDAIYFNGNVEGVDGIWKLQDLESPTLAVITDSSGLRFIKTVTNANAIAFTIAPPIIGDVAELWITRDGFATKNFVSSNVLQMEFAGGMLYYSEGVPSGGISIKRSDAGGTLSAMDLGTFSQVILDEVDEVIYAKVSAPNDKWQVLSSTGPNGTLQVDADFSGFKDLVADWQFENLGGKALGSTRFAMYGAELGITSPSTRVVLQNSLIAENNAPESIVGTIGTIWSNEDWGQANFSLVSGDGADSNSLFTIDTNNSLVSINSLDAEAQRLHSIRVRADYPGGQSIENVLTVFVQNMNETLDQVRLEGQTVSEGASIGTSFGKFVVPMAEPGELITYEVLSVDGNSSDMPFRTEGDLLLVNGPLDFETSANPSLEVRMTSSLGLSVVRAFQVFVTDVNENGSSPIQLSSSELYENNSGSVFIGNLSIPGADGSFTYSLDPTWHDSVLFSIEGDSLYFEGYADYELRDNYSIRVTASNEAGPYVAAPLTIDIRPVDEFPITGLRFIAGDVIDDLPFLFENSPVGMPATRIEVIDQDRGDVYEMSGTFGSFDNLGEYANIVGDSFVPSREINYELLSQTFGFPVNIAISTNGVPSFSVAWNTSSIRDVNDPPAISNPNSDLLVDADVWTSISLSDKFYDEDANDSLTFTASYNGGALPAWLFFSSFDTLAAIPTPADAGVYEIAITATDRSGASVTKVFRLTVEDPIDINGTLGDDTIRVTPTDTTGTAWSVFVNGTRTFTGVLTRSLLISGYTGNDRLIIEGTTVNDDFLFGGAIANVGALRTKFYDFESIQFAGRVGNDQFRFTGDANPVGSFAINGGTGTDTLVGADLPHVWTINGTDAGILGQITDAGIVGRVAFTSIENLAGGRSYNQFMMLTGGRITGSIEGRAGYDELNYSQRNANVAVTVADLELRAGTATNVTYFKGFEAFYSNPLQNSTFTLTDSVSERAMRWDIFADLIVTLEFTTTLVGFKSLVGSPNDDIFYSNDGASQINFDGSTGFDKIAQFGAFSTVDLRSGSGTGIASFRRIESFITYADQSELYGPNANSTWSVTFESVSVQGIAFQNYSTVLGGTRNDIFELAPLFSSTRNIVGGSGVDAIKTIDPFVNYISQANWLLTGVGSGQVTSMQATSLNFSGIENLVGGQVDFDFVEFASIPTQVWFTSLIGLLTGNIVVTYPASNSVTVNDPPVVVNLETKTATGFGRWDFIQYWIANSNSDKLIGRNLDTNWFITGSGGASSDSRTNFEGFETIVGGSRNDTFQINYGTVAVPRRIEGGAGRNMLDFTNYPEAVTLDLTAGSGSPFALGHSGFTDVIGSRFDDVLSGNSADNILIGLDGNDLLRGLAGNDVLLGGNGNDQLQGGNGRDLLVGGWGADFLFGGADDDLLISGVTFLFNNDNLGTYEGLDRNAIAAVMTEWTSTRTYAEKQARIRSGASSGGLYRLDSSTVFSDGAVDQLFGEGGRDWFWLDGLDFVQDSNNTETKDLV